MMGGGILGLVLSFGKGWIFIYAGKAEAKECESLTTVAA